MSKPNYFNLIVIFLIVLLVTSCKKDDSPINTDPVNNAPTINAQSFSIPEAISESTIIGNAAANDVDNDELSFSITNNSDDLFKITQSGAISLVSGKKLDFETNSIHKITVEVSDGIATANAQITINVTDIDETIGFITTWLTTDANESISIPTQESFTYDYTVDWGDGTALTDHAENASHIYEVADTYTVTITGKFPSIYFSNNNEIKNKIISIEHWGDIEWQSMKNAFEGCDNLTYNATDAPNLAMVTDMSAMFRDAPSFNAEDLSSWNVSSVTDMRSMFLLTPFNGNISTWDVSKVTDMSAMFFGAAAFNNDISTWEVSNVIDMSAMFNGTTSFNRDLSNWNTINVTNCFDFNANSGLASNNLPTKGACFTTYVADNGLGFITIWQTTTSNESITIPITATNVTIDWGDGTITQNGSNPSHTYEVDGTYDVIITGSFPSINFINLSSRDKIIDIKQWGNNKWATMWGAFTGCSNLNISATDAPDLSSVNEMGLIFGGATSLSADINHWDVSNVTDMDGMFSDATSFNSDLNNWDVSNVTKMDGMFYGATSFNRDLSNWDVSSVTDMSNMFIGAASFNGNISTWDVSSVTTMNGMFSAATTFNGDLNNWDVSSVITMNGMFNEANSFNNNLSNWDVSNVTDMRHMFYQANSFNQILSNWNTINVTYCSFFDDFSALISANLPTAGSCF